MSEASDDLELAPLEKAAERAGLGVLKAVVAEPNPRRDAWFSWNPQQLSVSRRVIERLRPDDACVLLLNAVLIQRRRQALRPLFVLCGLSAVSVVLVALMVTFGEGTPGWALALVVVIEALLAVGAAIGWAATQQRADDDTVAWLGEADTLCHALNSMDQDSLELGGRRVKARPDLHRRAERLAELHELRLPVEKRNVPALERRGPDVLA